MKKSEQRMSRKLLAPVALALLTAFGAAQAEEDASVVQLSNPDSTVSGGAGLVSGDVKNRTLFGQYNGLRQHSGDLLLDMDIRRRDDAAGSWMLLQGRNLGLDNRDLSGAYIKQGDWKLSADYSELVRHDPRSINTGLLNAGTSTSTTPTVTSLTAPGTGAELNLDMKRKGVTLAGEKWLTPHLLLEASFKNEEKEGARLFGRGISCGIYSSSNNVCGTTTTPTTALGQIGATAGAVLMLPEPIKTTTRQFESKLSYSGEQLRLTGGYYLSLFANSNRTLSPMVAGGMIAGGDSVVGKNGTAQTSLTDLLNQPLALAPDNQAHQLYLSGNYAWTPTTRTTFKLGYTRATQNEDFGALGTGNLGGLMENSLAQLGLTARPLAQLSLTANLRYDDRNDKTPYEQINATTIAQNTQKKLAGKLEASYQLPDNYRATLGVDYQSVNRQRPVGSSVFVDAGFTGLREKTEELGYRAELRRNMSETLNATVSYLSSKRAGGSWLSPTVVGYPAVADAAIYNRNGAFPMTLEDRKRDKVKLMAEWTASENVSLQFNVEDGKDSYTGPTEAGLKDTGVRNAGIDALWKITDAWKLTGYWNQGYQTQHVNHSNGYLAELKDTATSLGLGLTGKVAEKVDVGADLSTIDETNRYGLNLAAGGALAGGGLPDVSYKLLRFKLFGKYALDKSADLRLDVIHQRTRLDEWTWGYAGLPFATTDNSSVSLQANQNVSFLGLTYIYTLK